MFIRHGSIKNKESLLTKIFCRGLFSGVNVAYCMDFVNEKSTLEYICEMLGIKHHAQFTMKNHANIVGEYVLSQGTQRKLNIS